MIYNINNAKHLTDAQWIQLMQLIGTKEMELTMPSREGDSALLNYDGVKYRIESDGGYHATMKNRIDIT